jgi:hypothetical protein
VDEPDTLFSYTGLGFCFLSFLFLFRQRKLNLFCSKTNKKAGHWWLMPVILATQEAEIRRMEI